ncbi:hypothetical protein [Spirosoma fluminis]
MNTFELAISPKRNAGYRLPFSGPSSWKELTDAQQVALMRIRNQVSTKHEVLFAALRMLYGMKKRHQRWLFDDTFLRYKGLSDEDRALTLQQGISLLDTLSWIAEDDADAVFVKRFRRYSFQFGSPLVLVKRCFNRTLYVGPGEGLRDCTFEEFMYADKAFKDNNWPRLAAVLYRPRAAGSAERIPLDTKQIEKREALFTSLDPALLERIAFSHACTLMLLQRAFRFVFPKNQSSEEPTAGKSNKKSSDTWLDVAIGMAKHDVTKIPEIEKTNVYLALKVLNDQIRQAEEMDAQLESMKKK